MNQTPSIAIKTAKDLLAAEKKEDAVQALNEALTAKRNKQWQPEMETVITLLLDICIKTSNFKTAKDALHQYRSVCQSQNLSSLEKVILEFLSKVDKMMKDATENADKVIEKKKTEEESLESRILRSISGEDLEERTRRLAVSSAQKFMWESYRAVLDLIRNKQKLEGLYHKTAVMVMNFCVSYERKADFRRIGDLLRNHWSLLCSSSVPNNLFAVLSGPASVNFLYSVRFEYLNHAVKLELWQEAFKTVEDISEIGSVLKRQPPPQMLANYYEKLAQLFWVSHNFVFHSYAWLRFFILSKNQNRNLSDLDLQKMASLVLVSALSVPIESPQFSDQYFEFNIQKEKNSRLTALLGLSSNLKRDTLLKELVAHGITSLAQPELRDLFYLIEEKFHPLEMCKSLESMFKFIEDQPTLARYSTMIKKVCFTRQLQQLSRVYQTMNLSKILELAPVSSVDAVEKLVVKCANLQLISARLDLQHQRICFESNALESGTIKNQLSVIYEKLNTAVKLIQPDREKASLAKKKEFFKNAPKYARKENEAFLDRLDLIEEEKEKEETIEKLKVKINNLKAKLETIKAPQPSEEQSAAVEPVKNELPPPPTSASVSEIDEQKAQEIKVKREKTLKERIIGLTYKMDYFERAKREAELPLLKEWFDIECVGGEERHEEEQKKKQQEHREEYEKNLREKNRLTKVMQEKTTYEDEIRAQYEKEMQAWKEQSFAIQQQIEKEQEAIKEQIREKQRREQEERERQERELRERKEKEEQEKREREEQLAAQAKKQQEREREAQERMENELKAAEREQISAPPKDSERKWGQKSQDRSWKDRSDKSVATTGRFTESRASKESPWKSKGKEDLRPDSGSWRASSREKPFGGPKRFGSSADSQREFKEESREPRLEPPVAPKETSNRFERSSERSTGPKETSNRFERPSERSVAPKETFNRFERSSERSTGPKETSNRFERPSERSLAPKETSNRFERPSERPGDRAAWKSKSKREESSWRKPRDDQPPSSGSAWGNKRSKSSSEDRQERNPDTDWRNKKSGLETNKPSKPSASPTTEADDEGFTTVGKKKKI